MISYLTGTIKNINERSLTLLTSGGVGYKIYAPLNTLLSQDINDSIELLTHTVVKDDAIDLYGFTEKDELSMFEKLITVSGVGPRSALTILSVSSIQNIAIAVENGDANLLAGIPGVGKKSCEKIVIELKGKLSGFIKNKNINNKDIENNLLEENDARLALSSLGYNEKDINNAISEVKKIIGEKYENMKAGEIIRETLKNLR
jgi:Holliday junction DNA helicase RuvA